MGALLSRRRAVLGAVSVVGAVRAIRAPAEAQVAVLSANDARLVAIAAELRGVDAACAALSKAHRRAEDLPEWDALLSRFTPLEAERAETPADTMTGVLAKARALQVPTVASCLNGVGDSLAADLVRLQAEGTLA